MVLNPQSARSVEALANQMSVLDPDYSIETERRQARALAAASARTVGRWGGQPCGLGD